MSVVESQRKDAVMPSITKSFELAKYTISICSNEKVFPKRYRWCLTDTIVKTAVHISNYLVMANSVYVNSQDMYRLRVKYQVMAMALSKSLLSNMQLAKEVFGIDDDRMRYWTGLVYEVENLISTCRKNEAVRYCAFK